MVAINDKILILLLLFIPFCSPLNAQFGIRMGAGVSDIAFLEESQLSYLGYEIKSLNHKLPAFTTQAGVVAQLRTRGRYIPRAEVQISREGLNYNSSFLYDDIRYQLRITYLKLPILLKIDPDLRNNRQSGFIIGPYVSYALNSVLFTEIEGDKQKQKKDNVNRLDLGILGGYSWDMSSLMEQVFLDVRFSYSLINMMKQLEPFIPVYPGLAKEYARNVNIVFAIEYLF